MATDFLLAAGTNGFIATPFNLLSTEAGFDSLANGSSVVSSVGGTSGVFSQTNTAQAPQGGIWFQSGGSFTPTTGGYLAGWFLRSPDGGTTFEATTTSSATQPPVQRSPDFIIPLFPAAYASGTVSWAQGAEVPLPWESFKVALWNMSGVALPVSGNVVKLGPVALQY